MRLPAPSLSGGPCNSRRSSRTSDCRPATIRHGGCPPDESGKGLPALSAIVSHYIESHRWRAKDDLSFFSAQPTLLQAVRKAARAEDSRGKRYAHQRRIPQRVLQEGATYLEAALDRLASARTFEAIHRVVREEIGAIHGAGKLLIYDTALRIAAHRHLEPARVFLHAGTQVGARRLGLNAKAESLDVGDLPAALRRLRPHEIEDVLCMYKDELGRPR